MEKTDEEDGYMVSSSAGGRRDAARPEEVRETLPGQGWAGGHKCSRAGHHRHRKSRWGGRTGAPGSLGST
jgi:hypothetical protein